MKEAKDHSRCSPEGAIAGKALVRLTDPAIAELVAEGEADDRCPTCAFREGTVPNMCLQTQADAIKAVIEDVLFTCHHKKPIGSHVCHGWFAARYALRNNPGGAKKVPWEFSAPDDAQ